MDCQQYLNPWHKIAVQQTRRVDFGLEIGVVEYLLFYLEMHARRSVDRHVPVLFSISYRVKIYETLDFTVRLFTAGKGHRGNFVIIITLYCDCLESSRNICNYPINFLYTTKNLKISKWNLLRLSETFNLLIISKLCPDIEKFLIVVILLVVPLRKFSI